MAALAWVEIHPSRVSESHGHDFLEAGAPPQIGDFVGSQRS